MEKHRSAYTLIELLVVIAILAGLCAIALPAVVFTRESSRRAHCANNLKQIGLALHVYHDSYRVFPPGYASKVNPQDYDDLGPGWSWATFILPFMENQGVHKQVNLSQPIEAPANAVARLTTIPNFICPADGNFSESVNIPDYDTGETLCSAAASNYVASVGSVRQTCKLCRERGDGVFGRNTAVKLTRITDGSSRTFAAGERSHNISTPVWIGVVPHSMIMDKFKSGKVAAGPAYVLGTTFLHGDETELEMRAQGTVAEIFASAHPGVMNFVFCDGSVRAIETSIADFAYKALSTRDGKEPADGVLHEDPLPPTPPPVPDTPPTPVTPPQS